MNRKRLIQTICMNLKGGAYARGQYLKKKNIFGLIGERVRFQPRIIPLYPELIKLHNNIMIAADVRLITHDAAFLVLNGLSKEKKIHERVGCIEIEDNVFVGFGSMILPNVHIGSNVIVGAGSVVTKDLEPNGVYVGCPAKRIGSFDQFVEKMEPLQDGTFPYPTVSHNAKISKDEIMSAWEFFNSARDGKSETAE